MRKSYRGEYWVIVSHDSVGEKIYWSNRWGWTGLGEADCYKTYQKRLYALPMNSAPVKWENLRRQKTS
jgi:hypothetical protein